VRASVCLGFGSGRRVTVNRNRASKGVVVTRAIPAFLATALLVPLSAGAGEILKLQDAQGRVVYSDRRLPQTVELERLPVDARSEAAAGRKLALREQALEVRERGRDRSLALDQAWREIRAAGAALDIASQRLEAGREPRPGERLGNVGPTSRLTPAYFARVAALESGVAAAQSRVERAWTSLHGARE
jgi:hypothetical protein